MVAQSTPRTAAAATQPAALPTKNETTRWKRAKAPRSNASSASTGSKSSSKVKSELREAQVAAEMSEQSLLRERALHEEAALVRDRRLRDDCEATLLSLGDIADSVYRLRAPPFQLRSDHAAQRPKGEAC